MSIKTWWQNLGKQPSQYSSVDYHEKGIKEAEIVNDDWAKEYHTEKLEAAYKDENVLLRKMLQWAYTERKTPTASDVEAQLHRFSEACQALAHQKLLGVSEKSEISKIIAQAWVNERAKLMYLMFDDVPVPLEVVEQKIAEYKKEIENDQA